MGVGSSYPFQCASGSSTAESDDRPARSTSRRINDGIGPVPDMFATISSEATSNESIVDYFRDQIIGRDEVFVGPYGPRRVLYCDWTASGKALSCVEDYIRNEVLPMYANTHTETSATGIQMTHFREEARKIILQSVHGRHTRDLVLFCGTGATGAIAKMSGILERSESYDPSSTVVFIGPYEHNSNILIWREMGVHVELIPESKIGGVESDQEFLRRKLIEFGHLTLRIGSFSAASNVSGIREDTASVTKLLHEHGALSFWDFASGAPYLDIKMTCDECQSRALLSRLPSIGCRIPDADKIPRCERECACLDAVFISPHKFMGGPGSPGVLVLKRKIGVSDVPVTPGGGTVLFAFGKDASEFEYKDDMTEREEGGTQDIVASIRCAFAFMVKDAVSTREIELIEDKFVNRVVDAWGSHPNIRIMGIMGNTEMEMDRVATFSFYIVHEWNGIRKTLHHNFVAAMMNDLFGIQGRGGCSCAGLYGKSLLRLGSVDVNKYVSAIKYGNELSKPGFMRVNFHFTMTDDEVQYVIDVVTFIAEHGWRFIPMYRPVTETSEWIHIDLPSKGYRIRSLFTVDFSDNDMKYGRHHRVDPDGKVYESYLEEARTLAEDESMEYPTECTDADLISDPDTEWYWTPSEIMHHIRPDRYAITRTRSDYDIILRNRISVSEMDGDSEDCGQEFETKTN